MADEKKSFHFFPGKAAGKQKAKNTDAQNDEKIIRKNEFTRRKPVFQINIGSVVFFALFLYIVITVVLYLKAPNIKTYMVVQGPLAQNETYTAFALRDEQVLTANSAGYIHYFVNNKSKVSKGSSIYGLSDSEWSESTMQLDVTDTTMNNIHQSLSEFSKSYSKVNADSTEEFKYELTQKLLTESEVNISNGASIVGAPVDGIVVTAVDGYESYSPEMLTDSVFDNRRIANAAQSSSNDYVEIGDPACKIILDDVWSIAIKITAKQAVALEEYGSIRVKFLKDNQSIKGSVSITKNEEEDYYAIITFTSGMIRYAGDRFLEIELVTNSESGLKIPVSSVTQKEFYKIPASYLINGGDNSNDTGFLRYITDSKGNLVVDDSGNAMTEFVEATLYSYDTDEEGNILNYYVDKSTFARGDMLVAPDSSETYTVENTGNLEGVYCVNKGYTVFRHIIIINQNSEYCIVQSGTRYGISQYDYIVEDASKVHEEEILQR